MTKGDSSKLWLVEGRGESVSAVAREAGVSRQTAHKWIARAEAGEPL
ncbi:helix-turn-helix domain-containing protein [Tractidigestivibacter scatoligenes]|nr:helix-turn-helix domain-containing protein [Tractidigestivibacter scatoligenes]